MPSAFKFPLTNQIWLPMRSRAWDFPAHEGPRVLVFGRLADGIAVEAAEREMASLLERQGSDDPERFDQLAAEVVGMPALLLNERDDVWNEADVLVVQALVFGLLLIVCGNVGTLFLTRTAARSSELTIRTALGASRSRILTQLFVEALVLAVAATGLGLLAANAIAIRMGQMIAARVDTFAYWWVDFSLTPRIALIALGLAALCAAVIGVLARTLDNPACDPGQPQEGRAPWGFGALRRGPVVAHCERDCSVGRLPGARRHCVKKQECSAVEPARPRPGSLGGGHVHGATVGSSGFSERR